LIVGTTICLLPFIGKPFNIDDPLFIWAAKQIAHHPLDPYGFSVVWYQDEMPMYQVTKNPPLASYYAALIGPWTNWLEVPLHLAFLIPAVAVVLTTYELARGLTGEPLLAAGLTLAAPAFLVSSTSIMSDVPMLALWMVCVLAWRKGLNSGRGMYLSLSAFLIAVCALTKYFGACLIPLLFVYSIFKRRRVGFWAPYFLIPIAILTGYQFWTRSQYGEGLLLGLAEYAQGARAGQGLSMLAGVLIGLSFTGGCMLPVLLMSPWLFRKLWIAAGVVLAVPGAILLAWNLLGESTLAPDKTWLCVNLAVLIAGGIFALALAVLDVWRHRDADSVLLFAWVLGTFVFAAAVNWTVNARSMLPLVPAIAILIARRFDDFEGSGRLSRWVAVPVAVALGISLWLAAADASLAYSAREAARRAHDRTQATNMRGSVFFSGHWGFQYYMQALGARPVDIRKNEITTNDVMVQPKNNTNTFALPPQIIDSSDMFEINVNLGISALRPEMGAGFYSSVFGPAPFAFGRVPPEAYSIYHFKALPRQP
jgi:hypothetical protein